MEPGQSGTQARQTAKAVKCRDERRVGGGGGGGGEGGGGRDGTQTRLNTDTVKHRRDPNVTATSGPLEVSARADLGRQVRSFTRRQLADLLTLIWVWVSAGDRLPWPIEGGSRQGDTALPPTALGAMETAGWLVVRV